jgi:hypothetical protein
MIIKDRSPTWISMPACSNVLFLAGNQHNESQEKTARVATKALNKERGPTWIRMSLEILPDSKQDDTSQEKIERAAKKNEMRTFSWLHG